MEEKAPHPDRRSFLTALAMGGVATGYGACGLMAARYLYPSKPRRTGWQFVVRAADMQPGDALTYRSPIGESVTIAKKSADAFIALSSTCPHLGCQVHWEAHNDRFFCPCHNGVFDPEGRAVSGPPAEAGQSLSGYPLKIEDGLLFIQVPLEGLAVLQGPPRPVA
jgi:Rieske Fe-S protein